MSGQAMHNVTDHGAVGRENGNLEQEIRLADSVLRTRRHVCAFFHSPEQKYKVLLPFIKEGFERGEKTVHVVERYQRAEHLRRLQAAGMDVAAAENSGSFALLNSADVYLRDGHFDQERMLRLVEDVLDSGKSEGFPMTRCVGHMDWALEDRPGVDDLVEYEARLTAVLSRYEDLVICTYDLAKFDGSIVVDVMRTHPMIIIGGVLQENPFFVPPDAFLRELRERRA